MLFILMWTNHNNIKPHSVFTVQRGLVYRVCSEDGKWGQKNTSECEDDPREVCKQFVCVSVEKICVLKTNCYNSMLIRGTDV